MRVLVTGANGQLGSELVALYSARSDDEVLGVDLPDVDITSESSVGEVFASFSPDVVINCAAWTAVDAAEENEAGALAVNGEGPRVLARACRDAGAWLVQISTDYVFSGDATSPYAEGATPDPRSAYGRTKLVGEQAVVEELPEAHYIVRTAWLLRAPGQQLRQDDAAVGERTRHDRCGGRSSRSTDLRGGPGNANRRAARCTPTRRHIPRHQLRKRVLARVHPRDLPTHGR